MPPWLCKKFQGILDSSHAVVSQGYTGKETLEPTQNGKVKTGKRRQKSLSRSQDGKRNIKELLSKREDVI